MSTSQDVLKKIAENEVKFVDFRFTDTLGKEQHVSVPVSHIDEGKFTDGHAFDGSSIAGWKGIEASDMLLMPDPSTAHMDPFREESTMIITCDVLEPTDMKGYERDPRSLAKRAEAYLKSSGLGDTAFLVLSQSSSFLTASPGATICLVATSRSSPKKASGQLAWKRRRQLRTPSACKGRLLPRSSRRFNARHAFGDVLVARRSRYSRRSSSSRSGWRRSARNRYQIQHPRQTRADWNQIMKYTFITWHMLMARRRPSCPSQSWVTTAQACTCTSRSGKTVRTCSQATVMPACLSLRCTTSAASSSTHVH
jgi:hypothetical protein